MRFSKNQLLTKFAGYFGPHKKRDKNVNSCPFLTGDLGKKTGGRNNIKTFL